MMTAPEPEGIVWHTSSYCGNGVPASRLAGAPAATATTMGLHRGRDRVESRLVRDSKDRTGPALTVPTAARRAFLTTLPR
jgi:Domain of unknown function (DUF397)